MDSRCAEPARHRPRNAIVTEHSSRPKRPKPVLPFVNIRCRFNGSYGGYVMVHRFIVSRSGVPLAVIGAAGLVLGAPGTAAAGPDITQDTSFSSPSGNIGCQIIPGTSVRCDMLEHTWSPPPRPDYCKSLMAWGQGLILKAGGDAHVVCAGDTTMTKDNPLGYGDSITAGSLRCDSAESGMTCKDTGTGHGFTIARDSYNLF